MNFEVPTRPDDIHTLSALASVSDVRLRNYPQLKHTLLDYGSQALAVLNEGFYTILSID